MKTPKYSVFTVFAVLDDFEMHSSPPPASLSHPTTSQTRRTQGCLHVLPMPRIVCHAVHTVRGAPNTKSFSCQLQSCTRPTCSMGNTFPHVPGVRTPDPHSTPRIQLRFRVHLSVSDGKPGFWRMPTCTRMSRGGQRLCHLLSCACSLTPPATRSGVSVRLPVRHGDVPSATPAPQQ